MLIRLQHAHQWGTLHTRVEAAVRLCCQRLVPAVKAAAVRKGRFGEVAVEITASALSACQRSTRR